MDAKIFVALDSTPKEAIAIVDQLDPNICGVKIGKELFTWAGPQVIEYCNSLGFRVFLDLKFCDIPNTVAKAAIAAASHNIFMFTIHAIGGDKMISATKEAILSLKLKNPPKILAVTLLTSISQQDVDLLKVLQGSTTDIIDKLTYTALKNGADGIVCSPLEASRMRENFGNEFTIVTPGVRPASSDADDQARIATPQDAIENGSDFLVIGRPITKAKYPNQALSEIHKQLLGSNISNH